MKKRLVVYILTGCMIFSGLGTSLAATVNAEEINFGEEYISSEEMGEETDSSNFESDETDIENDSNAIDDVQETEIQDTEVQDEVQGEETEIVSSTEEIMFYENEEETTVTEETQEPSEVLKENSWRYSDGIWISQGVEVITDNVPNAWGKVDGYFVNNKGEKIEGAVAKGIDVSEHNGKIDWYKVKQSDVDFAILRVGYGDNYSSQDDETWHYNVSECVRLNIPFGVYIYSYAMSTAAAKSEAEHVLRLIKGYNLSYPVFFDMENEGGSYNQGALPAKTLGDIAETFCNIIENAGYEVGIYANKYWLTSKLTDSRFARWPKWVAQYNSVCDFYGDYIMWQCTDSGKVPGIDGNVDINFLFEEGDTGWETDAAGNKYYYENGQQVVGGKKIDGKWYYFDLNTGAMYQNRWREKEGKKYYYAENGHLVTNQGLKIDGAWYYFSTSGAMLCEEWREKEGKMYYYDANGHMIANRGLKINGAWYYFSASGAMLCEEWREKEGKMYYYDVSGHMVANRGLKINDAWYYFSASGAMLCEEWREKEGKMYYYDANGHMVANCGVKIDGAWYYFSASGAMLCEEWREKEGKMYYYDVNGHMIANRGVKIDGAWYYFSTSGAMLCEEWREKEGKMYYYDENGHLVVNRVMIIDGKEYHFDASGAMIEA